MHHSNVCDAVRLAGGTCNCSAGLAERRAAAGLSPDPLSVVLRDSMDRLGPRSVEFMDALYGRLFIAHPEIKTVLADTDMYDDKGRVFRGVRYLVDNIEHIGNLIPRLSRIGIHNEALKHPPTMEDYFAVWMALQGTLISFEGPLWTGELHRAWYTAYTMAASYMLAEGSRWRMCR